MSIDKLDVNTTANVEGEWFINENLDLAYFYVLAYDFVPLGTSTDVDSDSWSAIDVMPSLHTPLRSFLMIHEKASDIRGAFFEVPVSAKVRRQFYLKELNLN